MTHKAVDPELLRRALKVVAREGERREFRRWFRVILFVLFAAFLALFILRHAHAGPRCPGSSGCPVDYLGPIFDNPQWWLANPIARKTELEICAHPHLPADLPHLRSCKVAAEAERMAVGR